MSNFDQNKYRLRQFSKRLLQLNAKAMHGGLTPEERYELSEIRKYVDEYVNNYFDLPYENRNPLQLIIAQNLQSSAKTIALFSKTG